MKKRLLSLVLLVSVLLLLILPAKAAALDLPAPSSILMEAATGQILYENNAHQPLRPASVTKVMTLLLIMEALEDGRISWEDTITTSAAAAGKGGSQIYLEENEQLPLTEMLKAIVVSSANDCACAMAEHIAGSESAFVEMMNTRAQELGMENTHFINCTGLDDEPHADTHLSTAYDIALMSRALLQHEKIRPYMTIWMDTVRNGEFGLSNTNKLVRFYDGTTGLKTGYTSAAGFCLSASAKRSDMELIAVVMNCSTSTDRFESAKALLNYGFSNYTLVFPQPQQPIPSIPVILGYTPSITPVIQNESPILIEKARSSSVQMQLQVDEQVQAPIMQGQTLGTLTIYAENQILAEIPLVAPNSVQALCWFDIFRQLLATACMQS